MATAAQANTTTPTDNNNPANLPAKAQPREFRVVQDDGPLAYLFDTARYEHLHRIAQAMARAALIPDHLVGDKRGPYLPEQVVGNCFLIVNQSVRWGIDPFAAMPETYAVGGKLGFQGKLVAAIVNARAGLEENLRAEYEGTGDQRTATIIGRIKGEQADRVIEISVAQAKTDNKMWTKDPDQKLFYSGATKWARRHCPEIMLGVLTDDDLEHIAKDDDSQPAAKVETLSALTEHLTAPESSESDAPQEAETPAESADEPKSNRQLLGSLALELGCPAEDANHWVTIAETKGDEAGEYLNTKPWDAQEPGADEWDEFYTDLSSQLDNATGLQAVESCRKLAKGGPENSKLPADVETKVNQMCDQRREEISAGRGKKA